MFSKEEIQLGVELGMPVGATALPSICKSLSAIASVTGRAVGMWGGGWPRMVYKAINGDDEARTRLTIKAPLYAHKA